MVHPSLWGLLDQPVTLKVVDVEGLGKPSSGERMGDQVA